MAGENLASTVLTSMGRGSGVDVIKLARDLTDVTKLPRERETAARGSHGPLEGVAVT